MLSNRLNLIPVGDSIPGPKCYHNWGRKSIWCVLSVDNDQIGSGECKIGRRPSRTLAETDAGVYGWGGRAGRQGRQPRQARPGQAKPPASGALHGYSFGCRPVLSSKKAFLDLSLSFSGQALDYEVPLEIPPKFTTC